MIAENNGVALLAGQRLMVGFEGTELNSELTNLIRNFKVGGIILFASNIKSSSQVKNLCLSAQQYAKSCNLPPLFIAVDQEGGEVARLRKPDFTDFLGNNHISDIEEAKKFATITANEMKYVHINMNCAPVIDVVPDSNEMNANFRSVMQNRVFLGKPENVAKLGSQVIETLQQKGIMAVAKHFPGIGRTTKDSHLELPILKEEDVSYELMKTSDFIPFEAAIKSNVAAIMLSHILYSAIDNQWPASLSYKIAKTILRDEMGYQGVVMTDDLDMKAIKYDIPTSIRQILNAEIDIALICHKGPAIEVAFSEIKKLIETNELYYIKAIESAQRIRLLKRQYIL